MYAIGTVLVICLAVSLSSGKSPYWGNQKKCVSLTAPLQGSVHVSYRDTYKTSAVATYSCLEGYYIEGLDSRQCVGGVWQGKEPSCQKAECSLLSQPASGAVVKGFQLGKSSGWTEYQCSKGYRLIGDSTPICIQGKWMGKIPTCSPIQGLDRQCSEGKWTCDFPEARVYSTGPKLTTCKKTKQKAEYKCENGYKMIGQRTLTCKKGEVQGIPPSCQLDVFSESRVCNFSSTSPDCQYISDKNDVNKWDVVKLFPCNNGGRQRTARPQNARTAEVPLRPLELPASITQFLDTVDLAFRNISDQRARSALPVQMACPPAPITVLQLYLPGEVGIQTLRRQARQTETVLGTGLLTRVARESHIRHGQATLEVGPLFNEVARYVKFSVEAPTDALSYVLIVAGHCLPDPPGHLRVVHLIPPVSSAESVSRDFCLNLHDHVKCNTDRKGPFYFSLRVTLFYRYSGESAKTIRFIPKGVFRNFPDVCPGRKAENE